MLFLFYEYDISPPQSLCNNNNNNNKMSNFDVNEIADVARRLERDFDGAVGDDSVMVTIDLNDDDDVSLNDDDDVSLNDDDDESLNDDEILIDGQVYKKNCKPNCDCSELTADPIFPLPNGVVLECPICFDSIEMINMTVTRCGHTFHASCAFNAVERNICCPMCRTQLMNFEEDDSDDEDITDDEDDEDDDDNSEEETIEETILTVEEISAKLINMGYTIGDILRLYIGSKFDSANYNEEKVEKINDDLDNIMDGKIKLSHRDTRSYAQVLQSNIQTRSTTSTEFTRSPSPNVPYGSGSLQNNL